MANFDQESLLKEIANDRSTDSLTIEIRMDRRPLPDANQSKTNSNKICDIVINGDVVGAITTDQGVNSGTIWFHGVRRGYEIRRETIEEVMKTFPIHPRRWWDKKDWEIPRLGKRTAGINVTSSCRLCGTCDNLIKAVVTRERHCLQSRDTVFEYGNMRTDRLTHQVIRDKVSRAICSDCMQSQYDIRSRQLRKLTKIGAVGTTVSAALAACLVYYIIQYAPKPNATAIGFWVVFVIIFSLVTVLPFLSMYMSNRSLRKTIAGGPVECEHQFYLRDLQKYDAKFESESNSVQFER